jgi:hypothetical protein
MYIFYLDDSGNTGTNLDDPNQPIHFLAGIGVPANNIRKIEDEIEKNHPIFSPYSQNFDFEFHGVDIFQGKKYFSKFKLEERLKTIERLIEIAEQSEINFFSQGINKKRHKEKYNTPYPPNKVAFQYLIEKIDKFLEKKKQFGMIIIDQDKGRQQQTINDFWSFRKNGTPYGSFAREIKQIIDHPFYIRSYNSHMLQLADVLTYIHSSKKVSECLNKQNTYLRQKIIDWDNRIEKIIEYSYVDPDLFTTL